MRRPKTWLVRSAPPSSTPTSAARWKSALSCCRAGEEDVGRQLDLGDAEAVAEIQASALSGAEPWCELGGPVRAALGDEVWSEALTSCLQRVQVIDVQKRIVVLA